MRHGCLNKEATDPQRGVPDLFPSHILECFPIELQDDLIPKPRFCHIFVVCACGDADGFGYAKALFFHLRKGESFAAHLAALLLIYLT